MKRDLTKYISKGSILTSLTVLLQTSPVFLPIIGLFLSPLSTLPVALASYFNLYLGILVYLSSFILIFIFSSQEGLIFVFSTGLLGLFIGSFIKRKSIIFSIIISCLSLFIGLLSLTNILGIKVFGDFTDKIKNEIIYIVLLSFSFIYSLLSNLLINRLIDYLIKIKLLKIIIPIHKYVLYNHFDNYYFLLIYLQNASQPFA